jgi:hypothetical protein
VSSPVALTAAAGAETLAARIESMVAAGVDADGSAFEPLALDIHAHQYAANGPYRAYCDALGRSPSATRRWQYTPEIARERF